MESETYEKPPLSDVLPAIKLMNVFMRFMLAPAIDWRLILCGRAFVVCPPNNWLKRLLRKL